MSSPELEAVMPSDGALTEPSTGDTEAEEREEMSGGKGPLFVDDGLTIRQSVPTLWEVKSQSLP